MSMKFQRIAPERSPSGMVQVNVKTLTLSAVLGYLLWAVFYVACFLAARDISPLKLFYISFLELMSISIIFLLVGGVVVSCLLFFYYIISVICPRRRRVGEALFGALSGLIGAAIFLPHCPLERHWLIFLMLWGFFCAPALFTIFIQRGLEWYQRRR